MTPLNLPKLCDGCHCPFTVAHALSCMKGGLVIMRHNEMRNDLISVCQTCFAKGAVRDEPIIKTVVDPFNKRPEAVDPPCADDPTPEVTTKAEDLRGDLLVRNMWRNGTSCILDVRMTDTDAKSYRGRNPHRVIESQEREKKKKHLELCLEQRRDFTPFVVSVDGLFGKEAKAVIRRLASLLSEKWSRPYSQVCGYLKTRFSITAVRATHLCLRGSRIPADTISNRIPQWEDGAGLRLWC